MSQPPHEWNQGQPPYPQQPYAPQPQGAPPASPAARKLWVATLVGGCLGGLFLLGGILGSAPQQAAGGAVAAALVVIPYCMARAVSELRRS